MGQKAPSIHSHYKCETNTVQKMCSWKKKTTFNSDENTEAASLKKTVYMCGTFTHHAAVTTSRSRKGDI